MNGALTRHGDFLDQGVRRADPNSVRQWNEFAVVATLRELGPQRISALTHATGLTAAPLGEMLTGLAEKGWVEVIDPVPGQMGRPARLFGLHTPPGRVLGLDIGGRTVRAVSMTLNGEVLERRERRFTPGSDIETIRAVVAETVQSCLEGSEEDVWLTGIGITCIMDRDGIITASEALPEWEGLDPVEVLADELPSRAFALDEVRAEVMAEQWVGVAREVEDFLYVHVGRRPSLALMLDGRTRPGFHGAAGDLSQMERLPTKEDFAWFESEDDDSDRIGAAVRAAAEGNTKIIDQAMAAVAKYGESVMIAASIIDPELVVLGGAMTPIGEPFAERLQQILDSRMRFPPRVVVSELDEFGAALGSGLLALRIINDTLADPTEGIAPLTLEEFSEHPIPRV